MTKFEDTLLARNLIGSITDAYEAHKETALTEDELAVKNQKTIFYKWYCQLIYGHLYKDGICLRCGKIQ